MQHKQCSTCGKTKPLVEFDWKDKKAGKRKASCKKCRAAYYQEWYRANHEVQKERVIRYNNQHRHRNYLFIYNYFLKHPCVDCQEDNPLVLVFDHIAGDKRESIGRIAMNGCSIATIEKEIKKCEVRCFNCHAIRHAPQNRRGLWLIHQQNNDVSI